jgi:dTDP-4-amino-4,6-dideoxygalactose transaminase
MADMDPIRELAERYRLILIEDACQAHGAEYFSRKTQSWQKAGSIGRAAAFSFYPGKNLGAFGEAGAVVTDNVELQEKIRILRDHGQVRKYRHTMIGWNCRMDGIQAAVLNVKLQYLERGNLLRRVHALQYNRALRGVDEVVTPLEADYARHVYHIYAIRVQERDQVMWLLKEKGIQCGVHYPVPIHLQKAYQSLGYKDGAFPISEQIAKEFISLPMFPELTKAQVEMVALCVKEATTTGVLI